MDQNDELEIAEGLRAGDRDAWRRLYDAQAEGVWRLVARLMAVDAASVADVVQEIFLEAARGARGYDAQRGTLRAWLAGIARRQVALYYRRHQRSQITARNRAGTDDCESDVAAAPDPSPNDPADNLAAAETAEQVRATLTRLPTDYELLLTAKYVQQASVAEIAAADKSTHEGVRSKLARARRAFRRLHTKHFPHSSDGRATAHDAGR